MRLTGSRSRLGLGDEGDTSTAGPGRNLLATAECARVPATVSTPFALDKRQCHQILSVIDSMIET